MSAELHCGRHILDLSRPQVMGIVNVTPDSFSDGGETARVPDAIARARQMLDEGADLLDVGGESTRPGADLVTEAEEIDRVVPVVEALSADALVSVDTSKPAVMRAVIDAGASLINDVYALRKDGAVNAVADSSVGVCLMHMQGTPDSMQSDPQYDNVVEEVATFLGDRVRDCMQAGIDRKRLCLDPGFGFGKTVEHNLTLLRQLDGLRTEGLPVLAGLSRKRMIGSLLGLDIHERTTASVCLALLAIKNGARLVRVHDVAPTVQAIRLWQIVEYGG